MQTPEPKLIIDAPELLRKRLRTRDGLFTTLMWLVYAYLWLPLISLAAWLLGIDFAYDAMLRAGGIGGLLRLVEWCGYAALLIIAIIIGWSTVQRFRFGGSDRRGLIPRVSDAVLRASSELNADDFALLRSGRCLRVEFDDEARLRAVEPASEVEAA